MKSLSRRVSFARQKRVVAFAGIALAIGLIFTLEVCNRRLRSAQDLVEFTDLPVLAELPALPAAARRHRKREVRRQLKLQPGVAPAN